LLLAIAGLMTIAACTGSTAREGRPDASPAGLFPAHLRDGDLLRDDPGTLIKASAAKPHTHQFVFDATAKREGPLALVANCTTGTVHLGNAYGPCAGRPTAITTFCAGKHVHLTVSVEQDQPTRWGFALYKIGACS
jgi:hypothetical protein